MTGIYNKKSSSSVSINCLPCTYLSIQGVARRYSFFFWPLTVFHFLWIVWAIHKTGLSCFGVFNQDCCCFQRPLNGRLRSFVVIARLVYIAFPMGLGITQPMETTKKKKACSRRMFERRPFFTTVRHDNISSVRIWDITAVDIQSHRVSSAELRQACVLPWINLIILFRGNQQSEPENSRGKAGTKRWIKKKRKKKKDSEQLSVLLSFFQLNWHCLQQTPPPPLFYFLFRFLESETNISFNV